MLLFVNAASVVQETTPECSPQLSGKPVSSPAQSPPSTDTVDRRADEQQDKQTEGIRQYLLAPSCSLSQLRFCLLGMLSVTQEQTARLLVSILTAYRQFEILTQDSSTQRDACSLPEAVAHYEAAVDMISDLGPQPPELIDTISLLLEKIRGMALMFTPNKM